MIFNGGRMAWVASFSVLVGCGGGETSSSQGTGSGGHLAAGGTQALAAAHATGGTMPAASAGGSGGEAHGGVAVDAGSVTGSGGRAATAPVCIPGQSVACVGPGACAGGQACADDGSRYEPCVCKASGAGGGGAADAGDRPAPKPFTGPDGRQWACESWSDAQGTMRRCECSWYDPNDGRVWSCGKPGYDCSAMSCAVFRNDCCANPTGHDCICEGNGGPQNCDYPALNSCP